MTKEEYKRNLIRMFDSIRSNKRNKRNKHKGEKNCVGINCNNCPFNKICVPNINTMFYAHEAIDLVENWAKEHPIVTNADKFKEVFGLDMAPIHSCVSSKSCENCEYTYDGACAVSKLFWDAEYKPTKEGEE